MTWRMLALTCGAIALASTAAAGPWAREAGEVFLSYTFEAEGSRAALMDGDFETEAFHTIYAEVGVGRRLTAGLDLGFGDTTSLSTGFLRYSLAEPAAPLQIAVDAGLGWRDNAADAFMIYRLGGSIGHGFGPQATAWLPIFEPDGGWLTLDAMYLFDGSSDWQVWQAEATLGLNLTERLAGIAQIKSEDWPDQDFAISFAPSLLYRLNDATAVRVGGAFGVVGDDDISLRLGLWQEF